jgi:SRSO17 transposase
MDFAKIADEGDHFATYVEGLTSVIGHADRAEPLRDYCTGLLVAEGRRSVEPMAAVTAPKDAQVRDVLMTEAAEPIGNTPSEFREFIRSEAAKYAKIIRLTGVTVK